MSSGVLSESVSDIEASLKIFEPGKCNTFFRIKNEEEKDSKRSKY